MPHTTGGSYRSRPGHVNPRVARAMKRRRASNPSARAMTRASANARFKRTGARPNPMGARATAAKKFSSGTTSTRRAAFKRYK